VRQPLSADLEAELQAALGDVSLADVMSGEKPLAAGQLLESESRHTGRVIAVRAEDVFIQIGQRQEGVVPLQQFAKPPEVGAAVEVIVNRFDPEDGLYQLTLPGASLTLGDWSTVVEGAVVEAVVTGHNKGGLECQVNQLRGFVPASQVGLYRVENLAELVGQKLTCVITEANPERRNLVLSARAYLERQRAEAREKLLAELAPGQVREGRVSRLHDFGAFVDLGGVDGLLHVSKLSWGRVNHPRDVLKEGDRIQVKIEKFDSATRKISLSLRDLAQSPWEDADRKYPVKSIVRGKVTRTMEFGAFVELEPGLEGLIHISQIAHHRVWRVTDVLQVGQEVEAEVVSVDREKKRIGLSLKALQAKPVPKSEKADRPPEAEEEAPPTRKKYTGPLKGGIEKASGGRQFGLNW
jgi:small subunit ribosomal protein S1